MEEDKNMGEKSHLQGKERDTGPPSRLPEASYPTDYDFGLQVSKTMKWWTSDVWATQFVALCYSTLMLQSPLLRDAKNTACN